MRFRAIFVSLLAVLIILSSRTVACEASNDVPDLQVRIVVRNVEKIDLSESTFRIDFYLIIEAYLGEISLEQVRQFEFANGEPTIRVIEENIDESHVELVYRVKGDFIADYSLGMYPFDRHKISVILEFLTAATDPTFDALAIEMGDINVVGWEYEGIDFQYVEHRYFEDQPPVPRFVLSVYIRRPLMSTILKNVLPIAVISCIALLTFMISVKNPSQRIGLGVSTLLSATAFHLSLLGNIPPTGAFTLADGIMLSVYLLHFYSLLISVYLMRLKDREDEAGAEKLNRRALLVLPLVIIIPIIAAILTNR